MLTMVSSPSARQKWIMTLVFVILAMAPLYLSDFRLSLLGKFLAFVILALGLDLLWGYGGILSLGQGVFFGLGAYGMAMYLKLEASGGKLPDFMSWSGLTELPWFWLPFQNFLLAVVLAVLGPAVIAALLGYLTFRNRIRGVYFTILTQAMVIVCVTLFIGQQAYTGGTNGMTGFSTILGFPLASPRTQVMIYYIVLICFVLSFLLCYRLVHSRYGKVLIAIRDSENRLRYSGYNPAVLKTFVFALSAALAGLAGMLFVLQERYISPTSMGIIPSIEMALWVALGGRGTLYGAVLGTLFTNSAKTFFSERFPDLWLFFLGGLFIVVVLYLPGGLMSLYQKVSERWGKKHVTQHSPSVSESHR